ncbi:innexin inx2 isoform X2 [Eurytemora carolleeae]|uniref:innexin inx2 isoform X2 n=1 Tax=Eurytemora carolleeae TaxID=1294199 RepID=UPI000C7597E9|nr:innexin inx2 isoform X2 [Eurytemora carolleeae]|eukprot:XP_023325624.1 innexin inx2-like isoform X2 [Eurytemora affinis]
MNLELFCARTGRIIECAEEKCDSLLINYKEHLYNKYNRYFLAFFLCEIFNLAIAAGQFYITDKFLGRSYLSYGSDVYRYYSIPEEERGLYGNHNPMCQTFPRVVSCTYFRYGGGGRQEALQALCIIALNIIIDKVYLVLWIWFVILLIFGSFRIIQRCLQTLSIFRYHLLRLRMHRYFKDSEQCANIQAYVANCSIGDWFVLYQMSKNMNRRLFYMFLNKLAKSGRSPVKNKKDNNLAESLITVQKEEKSDAEKTPQENEEKDKKEEKEEKKADTVEETDERRRKKESLDREGRCIY